MAVEAPAQAHLQSATGRVPTGQRKRERGFAVPPFSRAWLGLVTLAVAFSCVRPAGPAGSPMCAEVDYGAISRLVTLPSVKAAEGRPGAKGWSPNAMTPGKCTPEGYWRFTLYEDKGEGHSPLANQLIFRVAPAGRLLDKEAHAELERLTNQLAVREQNPYGSSLRFPPVGARAWYRSVEDERRTIVRMTFTTQDERFDVEIESNTVRNLGPADTYWNYPGLLEESYRKAASHKDGG